MSSLNRESKTLLLFELWGLGDAVIATSAIQRSLENGFKVSVLCTGASKSLLARTYPDLDYHTFDLPWKAFKGKYKLWRWNWIELIQLFIFLLSRKDEVAMSVRYDPRDSVLMWLSGSRKRVGVESLGSNYLLTHTIKRTERHRVEDWNDLCDLAFDESCRNEAGKCNQTFRAPRLERRVKQKGRKLVMHVGARIAVRRLDLEVYRKLINDTRMMGWEVHVMADPDGYGAELEGDADYFYDQLTLDELQEVYEPCSAFIGNDSAPAHIAAAMGLPTMVFFGPTCAEWFRPWGSKVELIQDQVCPFKPCCDYCKLDSPICMEVLTYDRIKPSFDKFIKSLNNDITGK